MEQYQKSIFYVEKGVEGVADSGILAGFPIIDYKVKILDGLHHDVTRVFWLLKSPADPVLEKLVKRLH